jgi:integrase
MPRPGKGARLWLRPARRKSGRVIAKSVWIIRDGGRDYATGVIARSAEKRPPPEAERALAEHIANKYRPQRTQRHLEEIDVAIYLDDRADGQSNRPELERRIGRLNEFWGGRTLADVSAATCREYVTERGSAAGARRELEDLRAAINHHSRENLHAGLVRVTLPAKSSSRTRWLTRSEAARLLWACWRYRETQTVHRGSRKGDPVRTARYPLRHIARFVLLGLYSGTRAGAIASASPFPAEGRSFVDLDHGVFYRLATGRRATKKRQPPVPIPGRLLAHLRRWVRRRVAVSHFVEWNGSPVKRVKRGFAHAVELAGLDACVTPHTLRHTAATWLMQASVDLWEAADFLGMSVETLERNYGHHHPDHLRRAAHAIGYAKPTVRVSVVESVVEPSAATRSIKKVV